MELNVPGVNSLRRVEDIPSKEFLPDGKEDQTQIFQTEVDESGFPKVFFLRTEEVKMFLRIVQFYTCKMVWEEGSKKPGALELLLGMQFLEWYENLSVTSALFTKELQMIYTIWNSLIFENKTLEIDDSHSSLVLQFQEKINEHPKFFGHLTFRHYRSECRRDTFLSYIRNHLISQREIQRRNLNRTSHFKRSSDHSNSTRGNTFGRKIPPPRIKEFDSSELLEILELHPHERKIQLMGESSG